MTTPLHIVPAVPTDGTTALPPSTAQPQTIKPQASAAPAPSVVTRRVDDGFTAPADPLVLWDVARLVELVPGTTRASWLRRDIPALVSLDCAIAACNQFGMALCWKSNRKQVECTKSASKQRVAVGPSAATCSTARGSPSVDPPRSSATVSSPFTPEA